MQRSFLYIKENDFTKYQDENIFQAEAIVIDIYDASILFTNQHKLEPFFLKARNAGIKIYLKLDTIDLKRGSKALEHTKGNFIDGFAFHQLNRKALRFYTLRIREYELDNKLAYRALPFIVVLDTIKTINRIRNIVHNERVTHLVVKNLAYVDMEYVKEKITSIAHRFKKVLLEEKQFTYHVEDLDKINNLYTPSAEAIRQSVQFLEDFTAKTLKEKKKILKKENLTDHYEIVQLAKRLNLIETFPVIHYVVQPKKEKLLKKPFIIKKFYTVGEEIGNSVSHGLGIALSITALVLLILKSSSPVALASYITFAVSSLILYTMSTLYHAFALGKTAKNLFQKFDHMTIYLLIAGTYTPFSLLAIGGPIGIGICIFLWVGCAVGFMLNLFAFGKFRILHMILYIALGWVAIFFFPEILANISKPGTLLLIGGGIMYTFGTFFYALKLFKFTHMVWHIFTLLGTLLHFLSIYFFL
ncbi:MAG: hemolysin III family protein [Bacilli bacterium]|jgi:hemolysin III|nr:hemolysin III family protein [Bacilli bacterium]